MLVLELGRDAHTAANSSSATAALMSAAARTELGADLGDRRA